MPPPWQNSSWRFKAASAQHVFYSSFTLKPPFPFQSLPSPVVIEQASLQFTQTLQAQQSSSSLSLVSASPSLPFLLLWSYDFTKRQKPPTLLNKGLRKHFPCKDWMSYTYSGSEAVCLSFTAPQSLSLCSLVSKHLPYTS